MLFDLLCICIKQVVACGYFYYVRNRPMIFIYPSRKMTQIRHGRFEYFPSCGVTDLRNIQVSEQGWLSVYTSAILIGACMVLLTGPTYGNFSAS